MAELLALFFLILLAWSAPSPLSVHADISITTIPASTMLCPNSASVHGNSISVDEARASLYMACFDQDGGIISISLTTGATQVLVNKTQCPGASTTDVNSATGVLYASCWISSSDTTGSIIAIDPSSAYSATTIASCPSPNVVRVNSVTGVVYVDCMTTILAINVTGATPQVESYDCNEAVDLDIDPLTNSVYASCIRNDQYYTYASFLSLRDGVVTTLSSPCMVSTIVVDPMTGVVYIQCTTSTALPATILSYAQGIDSTAVISSSRCRVPVIGTVSEATGILYTTCISSNSFLAVRGGDVLVEVGLPDDPYPLYVDLSDVDETVYISLHNSPVLAIDMSAEAAATGNSTSSGEVGSINSSIQATVKPMVNGVNSAPCRSSGVFVDDSTSTVYAACLYGGIMSISLVTGEISMLTGSVSCPSSTSIHINPSNGFLYASCSGARSYIPGCILRLSTSYPYRSAVIAACPNAQSVRVNWVTGVVYAACANSTLIAIDTDGSVNELVNATLCPNPTSVDVDVANDLVYAACQDSGAIISVTGWNPLSTSVVTTLSTDSTTCADPRSVAVDGDTNVVYAACGSNSGVVAYTGGNQTVVATASQCPTPVNVAIGAATGHIYVACQDAGIIAIVGGSVMVEIADSTECASPSAISVSKRAGATYAACPNQPFPSTVMSITASSVTTYGTGSCGPSGVSVQSASGVVFVRCQAWRNFAVGVITIDGINSTQILSGLASNSSDIGIGSGGVPYIVDGGSSEVLQFNSNGTATVAGTVPCTAASRTHIAVDDDRGLIIITCGFRASVTGGSLHSIFVLVTGAMTAVSAADATVVPYAGPIAVDPVTGVVYVESAPKGVLALTLSVIGTGASATISSTVTTAVPIASCSHVWDLTIDSTSRLMRLTCASAISEYNLTSSVLTSLSSPCHGSSTFQMSSASTNGGAFLLCQSGPVRAGYNLDSTSSALGLTLTSSTTCTSGRQVRIDQSTGLAYLACAQTGLVVVSTDFNCPPGLTLNSTGCTPCPARTYRGPTQVATRVVECTACPNGTFSSLGATYCDIDCAAGQYSSHAACLPCDAGYFGSAIESTAVTPKCSGACFAGYWCDAGSNSSMQHACGSASVYCPSGSSSPVTVSNGFYSTSPADFADPDATMTRVLPCPAGSSCTEGVATECAAGEYQNATGQTSCNPCPVGRYSQANSTSCTECGVGTYANSSCSPECTPCAAGSYQSSTGEASCLLCVAGYWCATGSNSSTQHVCGSTAVYCPSGSSSPLTVADGFYSIEPADDDNPQATMSAQAACPSGTFCVRGLLTNCSAGEYQNSTGQTSCSTCATGSYSREGATECSACAVDTYSSHVNSTSCTACASGFYSSAGATVCSVAVAALTLTAPTTVGQCDTISLNASATADHGTVTASEITSIEWSVTSILSGSGDQLLPTAAGYNATAAALVQSANSGTLAQLSEALTQAVTLSPLVSFSVPAGILWVNCTYVWRAIVTVLLPAWDDPASLLAASSTTVQSIGAIAWLPAATTVIPMQMRRSESQTLAFTLVSNACKTLPVDVAIDSHWVITDADEPTTTLLECITAECTLPPLLMTIGRVYVSTLHLRLTRTSTGEWIGLTSQTGFQPVASPLIAGFDAPTCDVDSGQPLMLDAATYSYDPDDATRYATALAFKWQCSRLVTSSVTGNAIVTAASCALPSAIDFTSSLLLIPAHSLQSGVQYQFSVAVSTADGRSAAHAAVVTTSRTSELI